MFRQAAIVVVANTVNVSIFREPWLMEHGVFTQQELSDSEVVVSPIAASIRHSDVTLLVVPDRIQITMVDSDVARATGCRVMSKILAILPHTPVKGLGINFEYAVKIQPGSMAGMRQMLLSSKNPLGQFFQDDAARFGFHASQEWEPGVRLNMDVRSAKNAEYGEHSILNFNFHVGSGAERDAGHFSSALENWSKFLNYSETIAATYEREVTS